MSDPLRDQYVEALEAENDALRARLRDLEREYGFYNEVPLMFGLTGSESKVMGLLIERDIANRQQLMTAIMLGRGGDEEPEMKIIDVHICRIRKKLKPFGVEIDSAWGRGYCLSTANKAKVAAYLTQAQQAAE